MELLVSLIAGAVGGNLSAGLMKNLNLGLMTNSFAGVLGGGLGGQILAAIGAGGLAHSATVGGAIDPTALAGQMAAGGLGGALLLLTLGTMRNLMTR